MIKLKKQVEKKKIRHLFNKSCIVLFIHCNDTQTLRRLFIEKHISQPHFQHNIKVQRNVFDNYDKKFSTDYKSNRFNGFNNQQDVHCILVQNNNAKQVLLQDFVDHTRSSPQYTAYSTKICKPNVDQQIKINSLLQGPTVLLGMYDLNSLDSTLHTLKENGKSVLLGAVYGNNIINHSQVNHLALLSKECNSYEKLIYILKKPVNLLCLVSSMLRNKLENVTLKQRQNKLISLLRHLKKK